MKRALLHISFWVAYVIQGALLEYLWFGPSLSGMPENVQLRKAFILALVVVIPKLLFAYYLMYVAIPRIIAGRSKLIWIAGEIGILLFAFIVIYRIMFSQYIFPVLYNGIIPSQPIFNPRLMLLGLMDIGFVSGAAVTFKLLRTQLTGKEREKNLVKEKLGAELKFLRNQTNPHFLFNTLNNIYGLARRKSDQTPEAVMKLSKLLRFMIYESKKDFISIEEEIKILEDYIELEKIRYNGRLRMSFNKSIDDLGQPIAPLLLLPLVENAFKHGASESRFQSFINIDMLVENGQLYFNIVNNKENASGDITKYNIGLGNLRRQLELTYKMYSLEVGNGEEIFKVDLSINLNSYANV